MNQISFISSCILILIAGCAGNTSRTIQEPVRWDMMSIEVDGKSLWVFSDKDSCLYSVRGAKEKGAVTGRIRIDSLTRDTIMKLAAEEIAKPKQTEQHVSCYAGQYVTIRLEQGATVISCKYNSVEEWTAISSTLARLASLTIDKISRNN